MKPETRAALLAAHLLAASSLCAGAGRAQELTLSANATLTTNYMFRGISQTAGDPAMQGGFEAYYGAYYLGIWGSNVDFGTTDAPNGARVDIADIEIDYYGGVRKTLWGMDWDVGAYFTSYPGAYDPAGELDYLELNASFEKTLLERWSVKLAGHWSPNYSGDVGPVGILSLTTEYALGRVWIFDPAVSAKIGRQIGDEAVENLDYTYWNFGLTLVPRARPVYSFDLRYWDTDLSTCINATASQCGPTLVGSLNAVF